MFTPQTNWANREPKGEMRYISLIGSSDPTDGEIKINYFNRLCFSAQISIDTLFYKNARKKEAGKPYKK